MIRVQRGAAPAGFTAHAADLNARFRAQSKTASAFWSDVRPELRAEAEVLYQAFHGKCAFCESHMAHVAPAQIEHYRPKKHFPEDMFNWENWLLSCGQCNTKKGQRRDFLEPNCDGRRCLLNPAEDDPLDDLHFKNQMIFGDSRRGTETIRITKLSRDALNKKREEWLVIIRLVLQLTAFEETLQQARNFLIWAMQDDAPYAAMTRCYLAERTPILASSLHPIVTFEDVNAEIEALVELDRDRLRNLA